MTAILLHHAGGDKYSFRNMQQWLSPEIESIAVELPGRSERFNEPLLTDMHEITKDVFYQIKDKLNTDDYFFVGISMGTLIAYLLCHTIKENKLSLPKHLFLASRLAPDAYIHEPTVTHASSKDFWKVIMQYNGVPQGLMEHTELREFYEPILRADFEALEKYNVAHIPREKLTIPASILIGNKDIKNITTQTAQNWNDHFTNNIEFKEFDGGHFFLYENEAATRYIKSTMIGK